MFLYSSADMQPRVYGLAARRGQLLLLTGTCWPSPSRRCIKKNHVCPKGLVKEGTQCCEACPTNCEVKDGYCYAP